MNNEQNEKKSFEEFEQKLTPILEYASLHVKELIKDIFAKDEFKKTILECGINIYSLGWTVLAIVIKADIESLEHFLEENNDADFYKYMKMDFQRGALLFYGIVQDFSNKANKIEEKINKKK